VAAIPATLAQSNAPLRIAELSQCELVSSRGQSPIFRPDTTNSNHAMRGPYHAPDTRSPKRSRVTPMNIGASGHEAHERPGGSESRLVRTRETDANCMVMLVAALATSKIGPATPLPLPKVWQNAGQGALVFDFGRACGCLIERLPEASILKRCRGVAAANITVVVVEFVDEGAPLLESIGRLFGKMMAGAEAAAAAYGVDMWKLLEMEEFRRVGGVRATPGTNIYDDLIAATVSAGRPGQSEAPVRELIAHSCGDGASMSTVDATAARVLEELAAALARMVGEHGSVRAAGQSEDGNPDMQRHLAEAAHCGDDGVSDEGDGELPAGWDSLVPDEDPGCGGVPGGAVGNLSVAAPQPAQTVLDHPPVPPVGHDPPIASSQPAATSSHPAAAPRRGRFGPPAYGGGIGALLGREAAAAAAAGRETASQAAAATSSEGLRTLSASVAVHTGASSAAVPQQVHAASAAVGGTVEVEAALTHLAYLASSARPAAGTDSASQALHVPRTVPVSRIRGPLAPAVTVVAVFGSRFAELAGQFREVAARAGCDMGAINTRTVPFTNVSVEKCWEGLKPLVGNADTVTLYQLIALPGDEKAGRPDGFNAALVPCLNLDASPYDRVASVCAWEKLHGASVEATPAFRAANPPRKPVYCLWPYEGNHIVLLEELAGGEFEVILHSNIAAFVAPNGQPWLVFPDSDRGSKGLRPWDERLTTVLSVASRNAEAGRVLQYAACIPYHHGKGTMTCGCIYIAAARYGAMFSHTMLQNAPSVVSQSGFCRTKSAGAASRSSQAAARVQTGLPLGMMGSPSAPGSGCSAVQHQADTGTHAVAGGRAPTARGDAALAPVPGAAGAAASAPVSQSQRSLTRNVATLLCRGPATELPYLNKLREYADGTGKRYSIELLRALQRIPNRELAIAGGLVFPSLGPIAQRAVTIMVAAHGICRAVCEVAPMHEVGGTGPRGGLAESLRPLRLALDTLSSDLLCALSALSNTDSSSVAHEATMAGDTAPAAVATGDAAAASGSIRAAGIANTSSEGRGGAEFDALSATVVSSRSGLASAGSEGAEGASSGAPSPGGDWLVQRGLEHVRDLGIRGEVVAVVIRSAAVRFMMPPRPAGAAGAAGAARAKRAAAARAKRAAAAMAAALACLPVLPAPLAARGRAQIAVAVSAVAAAAATAGASAAVVLLAVRGTRLLPLPAVLAATIRARATARCARRGVAPVTVLAAVLILPWHTASLQPTSLVKRSARADRMRPISTSVSAPAQSRQRRPSPPICYNKREWGNASLLRPSTQRCVGARPCIAILLTAARKV